MRTTLAVLVFTLVAFGILVALLAWFPLLWVAVPSSILFGGLIVYTMRCKAALMRDVLVRRMLVRTYEEGRDTIGVGALAMLLSTPDVIAAREAAEQREEETWHNRSRSDR